jgi:hypothetical protein
MRQPRYQQHTYIPKNREKYRGKIPIQTRSSWELKMCQFLDINPKIVEWIFEPLWITYFHPIKKKPARYLPDFWIKTVNNEIFVIELGQHKHKVIRGESKSKKAKTRAYTNYMRIENEAKFKAAEEFCQKKGWEFKIVTEKQMFLYD